MARYRCIMLNGTWRGLRLRWCNMVGRLLAEGLWWGQLHNRGMRIPIVIDTFQMSSRTPTAWGLSVAFELPFATRLARHWVLSRMLPSTGGLLGCSTGSFHHGSCSGLTIILEYVGRSSALWLRERYVQGLPHGDLELPWRLRLTLNRIRPITAINMRCNNKSSAEHAKVRVNHFVALGLHGGYGASERIT
jgi:hypothetical protein